MKLAIAGVFLSSLAMAFGCATDTDTSNRPLFNNGDSIFQAQVFDGMTGSAVSGATLSIFVGPSTLTSTYDANSGRYSVIDIPPGTWSVMASANGYNTFQSQPLNFNGNNSCFVNDPNAGCYAPINYAYTYKSIILYATSAATAPPNITVAARYLKTLYKSGSTTPIANPGDPVVGAPVYALMTATTSNPLLGGLGNILQPASLISGVATPNLLTATATDSGGNTVIAGSSLVFGAQYTIYSVGAKDTAGDYLVVTSSTPANASITVDGTKFPDVVFFLDAAANTNVVASYANSNDVPPPVSDLVVKFPYAMALCNPTPGSPMPTAQWTSSGICTGIAPTTPPAASATASFDTTNTVLTVSPAITTQPTATCSVSFTGVWVQPIGSTTCTQLGNVTLRTNGTGFVNPQIEIHQ